MLIEREVKENNAINYIYSSITHITNDTFPFFNLKKYCNAPNKRSIPTIYQCMSISLLPPLFHLITSILRVKNTFPLLYLDHQVSYHQNLQQTSPTPSSYISILLLRYFGLLIERKQVSPIRLS